MVDTTDIINSFNEYVTNSFDFGCKQILMKYKHSIRVMDLCLYIADCIGYDDLDMIAVVGLLHDYGRFYQWKTYNTFHDQDSIDHADYGVKLLFDDGDIKNFVDDRDKYDSIFNAIKYHNKYAIPDDLDSNSVILTKVVRDADKIDILHLASVRDDVVSSNGFISASVRDEFYSHKLVSRANMKCPADYVICTLSFIFDINYSCSLDYLSKENILEKYYDSLDNKELFTEYFDYVKEFISRSS